MAKEGRVRRVSLFPFLQKRFTEFTAKEIYGRILCGEVRVNGGILRDPKALIGKNSCIEFLGNRYVSRGGEKLAHALELFPVNVEGKICLDAGSSTGGFTHCLLTRGAVEVHAVDVGFNRLSYGLRRDPRVLVHERTNIMDLEALDPLPHGATADLSFRSIRGAASHILALTKERWLIALIKPQFEWRNPPAAFDGVVRDIGILRGILEEVVKLLLEEEVFLHAALLSPIRGRKGNREFFFFLKDLPGPDATRILDSLDQE